MLVQTIYTPQTGMTDFVEGNQIKLKNMWIRAGLHERVKLQTHQAASRTLSPQCITRHVQIARVSQFTNRSEIGRHRVVL